MQTTGLDGSRGAIRPLVESFFRHRLLFLLLFGAVVASVAAVTLLSPNQYRSEMKFLLENNRSTPVITPDRSAGQGSSEITEQQINSELEVLGSDDVLTAAADPFSRTPNTAPVSPVDLKMHEKTITDFRKRLKIDAPRKSNVVTVSFTARSQPEAMTTLQRFAAAYLAQRKRLSRPDGTSQFFVDEARRYKDTWEQANANMVAFQQQHHLVSVPEQEETLNKQIAALEEDVRDNKTSVEETQRRYLASAQATVRVPVRQNTQQHTIFNQMSVDQMRTLLVQLRNRRTEQATRYNSSDRTVKELDHQILDTETALNQAQTQKGSEDTTDINPTWQQVRSASVMEKIDLDALRARGTSVSAALVGLNKQLGELQQLDVTYNGLQEQVDQARSNFELFSEKRDKAQIEDSMDEHKLVNVAIAENPTAAFHPVSPKPLLNAALGVLAAFFLAGAAIYMAESSRRTFATPRELESSSKYPVLATIPLAPLGREGRRFLPSVERDELPSTFAVREMAASLSNLRNTEEA
ncbi:MAG: hypothetical protein JWM54_438 [Acidobacteriaceae bacterium]|nr:hypothetical protein [Acidobacteriaceae bacterium]